MKELPSRMHRFFGVLFFGGVLLFLAALLLDIATLRPLSLVAVGGSAFALALADLRTMHLERRGVGRLSGHITEAESPFSFKLHIALTLFLALLWASLFAVGLRELAS